MLETNRPPGLEKLLWMCYTSIRFCPYSRPLGSQGILVDKGKERVCVLDRKLDVIQYRSGESSLPLNTTMKCTSHQQDGMYLRVSYCLVSWTRHANVSLADCLYLYRVRSIAGSMSEDSESCASREVSPSKDCRRRRQRERRLPTFVQLSIGTTPPTTPPVVGGDIGRTGFTPTASPLYGETVSLQRVWHSSPSLTAAGGSHTL